MSVPLCQKCLYHHFAGSACIEDRQADVYRPFIPYWDEHLRSRPVYIDSPATKQKLLRGRWKDDNYISLYEKR
jgi:hypothetical protein